MPTALSQYLDTVRDNLRLDFATEEEIIGELETLIEDRLEEMKEKGLSEEEATSTCVRLLGSARSLARRLYEAHSQGTWKQVLLATMPHLFFALLFTLNWWQGVGWLLGILGLISGVAVYGWWHGKPLWLFPWLSYSLIPVVVAGLSLLYLPEGWAWLATLFYVPTAAWLVCSVTMKTVKKDWLYGALMLFPVPVIIGWVLVLGREGKPFEIGLETISYFAPWIGLSFLAIAATVAVFFRLRQRWLRVTLLLTSGLANLVLLACCAGGRLELPVFLFLLLTMVTLLLGPALVEKRVRSGRHRATAVLSSG